MQNIKSHRISLTDTRALLLWPAVFALATALASNLAVRLPFTPVPVTLQVLTVILSGLALGSRGGAVSQLEYILIGTAGAPVFAGGGSGPAYLLGPTGGYLFGFVAAAYLIGFIFERLSSRTVKASGKAAVRYIAALSGIPVIYISGTAWLAVWLMIFKSAPLSASYLQAWKLGASPFIMLDLIKAFGAAAIINGGLSFWNHLSVRKPFSR